MEKLGSERFQLSIISFFTLFYTLRRHRNIFWLLSTQICPHSSGYFWAAGRSAGQGQWQTPQTGPERCCPAVPCLRSQRPRRGRRQTEPESLAEVVWNFMFAIWSPPPVASLKTIERSAKPVESLLFVDEVCGQVKGSYRCQPARSDVKKPEQDSLCLPAFLRSSCHHKTCRLSSQQTAFETG